MKKCLFSGFISTLAYVEQLGGLLYSFRHFGDLNLDLDAPVAVFWRLRYLRFDKLGPPFHIKLLNESFEIIVSTKIAGCRTEVRPPWINPRIN